MIALVMHNKLKNCLKFQFFSFSAIFGKELQQNYATKIVKPKNIINTLGALAE